MIREAPRPNPTVHIPPWDTYDDPTVAMSSPFSAFAFNGYAGGDYPLSPSPILDLFPSLHRYLPSNEFDSLSDDVDSSPDSPTDAFSCDEFRMYEFKVRKCLRGRAHDWTDCPFAHPGEKAQRRDPRKYHYSGTPCPEFRKGSCRKGDACEYAHGVFECWLHPSRYRTQPCKDGTSCRRRVCFFAHTPEQLRVLTQHDSFSGGEFDTETSPVSRRLMTDPYFNNKPYVSSPISILISPPVSPPSGSPPMSPADSHVASYKSSLVASMRKLQLEKSKICGSLPSISGFGSPGFSSLRPGVSSTPTTPTRTPPRSGLGGSDFWDCFTCNEDPIMERVESGKELRTKLYAKLSKENSLGRVDSVTTGSDAGWVSELFK